MTYAAPCVSYEVAAFGLADAFAPRRTLQNEEFEAIGLRGAGLITRKFALIFLVVLGAGYFTHAGYKCRDNGGSSKR